MRVDSCRQPTIWFVPESPRWLFAIGKSDDAIDVIARIYGTTTDSEIVVQTRTAMQVEIEMETSVAEGGWTFFLTCAKALFYDNTELNLGRRLRLCILISFLQEMSGLNIVSGSSLA